ncbi:MAG: 3'-5' exonuclease [Deltaproteobacteria bacterium]|nr:3'-5' exonuclease [Deltaproteobacteria bacterium]
MNFLALDFETANYYQDSACALGLVRVEDNRIVDQASFLIRPPYRYFVFTYIHGITWEDVADQPTFAEHWQSIKPFFEGIDFAVAHNASFDRNVLRACCERHGIIKPAVDFQCTMKLSRKVFHLYPTNLPAVCRNFNIDLQHHDALSDTLACARIMIEILKKQDLNQYRPFRNRNIL